ncbi:MAG TPA: GNAT family N-acetyltransferase [Longimicrobiales bacterium]|nr:GNAT family N-acetyltransferase [Longimicrobiales bacterium]
MSDDAASDLAIRRAAPADAATLAGMRLEFRSAFRAPSEDDAEFLRRCTAWMAARLAQEGAWRCWVAERDGRVLGHIWAQRIEKIPNPVAEPESHGYITNLFVREEARGAGTGARLLEAALAWCRDFGAHAVLLWPTDRSRTLYRRYGFEVREDVMELLLGESGV